MLQGAKNTFRMRHHDGETPVRAGQRCYALFRTIRVGRVVLRGSLSVGIDVSQAGCFFQIRNVALWIDAPFPVRDDDREAAAGHALKQDRG